MKPVARRSVWPVVVSCMVLTLVPVFSQVEGAEWLPGVDARGAAWVKELEEKLNENAYRDVFASGPRTPQESVIRLLNQAAVASAQNNRPLADSFVQRAIAVLEDGVRKHYYTKSDIEPILTFIQERAGMADTTALNDAS